MDLLAGEGGHSPVTVWNASEAGARQLAETQRRLTEQRAQWLYYNRNLRVYEGSPNLYIETAAQRFHWTRTQAIQDAARRSSLIVWNAALRLSQDAQLMLDGPSQQQQTLYRVAFVQNCFVAFLVRAYGVMDAHSLQARKSHTSLASSVRSARTIIESGDAAPWMSIWRFSTIHRKPWPAATGRSAPVSILNLCVLDVGCGRDFTSKPSGYTIRLRERIFRIGRAWDVRQWRIRWELAVGWHARLCAV